MYIIFIALIAITFWFCLCVAIVMILQDLWKNLKIELEKFVKRDSVNKNGLLLIIYALAAMNSIPFVSTATIEGICYIGLSFLIIVVGFNTFLESK